ncbi:MAG: type II toxin-antitoxin system death-on-curing family toxin [Acidimicrobiales bacterium]
MNVEYPDIADYLAIAAAVTGSDLQTIYSATNLGLADSALHAPSASFGDQEFYPDFCDKAAVLLVRLAKNHRLLDGNKRAAWVTLRLFIELNSWTWTAYPSVDDSEQVVLAVASGEWDVHRTSTWLRERLSQPNSGS